MKNTKNKTLLILILMITLSTLVYSQKLNLTIDNGSGDTIETNLSISADVTIDGNGDVNVTVDEDKTELAVILNIDTAPILVFSVDNTNITSGDTIYLSWSIANTPTSCTKTDAWTGNMSSGSITNGSHSFGISNVTSNRTYSLSCQNASGTSDTLSVTINVESAAINPTLTVSTSPSTIEPGESSTITWVIANTPTSCTKSGNWPGGQNMSAGSITNGTHTLTVNNITIDRVYNLLCDNNALSNSGIKTATIEVEEVFAPTLNFSTSPTNITSGDSTTLSWTIGNSPTSCAKSGDWTGNLITSEMTNGMHSTTITDITSNQTYNLICSNSGGNSGTLTATVTVGSVNPPTLTFTASPTSVTSGGSTTLSWTIGNSPTSCTKSGDWSGVLTAGNITNGTHTTNMSGLTAAQTYNLICENSGGNTGILSASIAVTSSACISQPPILGGAEDTTIHANNTPNAGTYNNLYSDFQGDGTVKPWPGSQGENFHLSLTKNEYIAAQFNSGNITYTGRIDLTPPNGLEGPLPTGVSLAVSECPGDFDVHLNQTKCLVKGGATPNFWWSTDPNASSFYCKLEKNKTYYLNIVHSNDNENNGFITSDCPSGLGYCGILGKQIF